MEIPGKRLKEEKDIISPREVYYHKRNRWVHLYKAVSQGCSDYHLAEIFSSRTLQGSGWIRITPWFWAASGKSLYSIKKWKKKYLKVSQSENICH